MGESVTQVDIAIVGGGLVGASLAAALAPLIERHALKVAVIEANPVMAAASRADTNMASPALEGGYQPSFDARASAIAWGTCQHFAELGLWPMLAEQAEPIRAIHVSERGRLGVTRLTAEELAVEALGYVIPNAWLGRVLHHRLSELTLEWHCPARVETITAQEMGHRLRLSNGYVLEAGLTVLADGGRSGLKEQLGIASHSASYDQVALLANLEVSKPHEGVAFERFTAQGPMALLPLSGQRMELIWTCPAGGEQALLSLSDSEFLARLQQTFGDRAGRFRRVATRHCYPLALVTAEEPIRPGLAVLGNAAHALHPVAGQGFNLALRGVVDLVAALDAAYARDESLGSAATLADFERRREADRHNVIRFSDGLIRLFGVDSCGLSHARAAGLVGLNLAGPLRRGLARRAMGIER